MLGAARRACDTPRVARPAYRPSPVTVRQLHFTSDEDADGADGSSGQIVKISSRSALSTTALSKLSTKLALKDIPNWIKDFKAAVGRVDVQAGLLLSAADWRVLISCSGDWALEANKRLADAIMASLDSTGDNVILLESKLREADSTDRPGVLFSGMDILEEIQALITERTLGEIKLNSEEAKEIVFKPGASLNSTRLVAEELKKAFVLKPAAERAVPNALLHDLIAKMPDEGGARLALKKEDYQDSLYKAEMKGASPPWTIAELIDNIAVDLARAPPVERKEVSAKEVASVDLPKPKVQLTSTYKCSNCGALGKHLNQDCPRVCFECKNNFCPGARDELCAVLCDELPSKRSLQNGIGKDLHPFLIAKLDAAWKTKHPGREVSSLEIQNDSDSDAEVFGLVIPGRRGVGA